MIESVETYLEGQHPKMKLLLHEQVMLDSLGLLSKRKLPAPHNTKWNKKTGLEPVMKERHSGQESAAKD